jgi:hypothetical protein
MLPVVSALLALVRSLLRSRWVLHLQVLALQHQVAVYKQTVRRPRLSPTDRLFWSWLSWLWAGWQDVLALVQPRTVMAWQRTRFRDYYTITTAGRLNHSSFKRCSNSSSISSAA